mmetsp:Transcript_26452/g.37243  ORF Transcript_26452/g.37243 Transcript_26452/m.37243 type:complete len:268 (-) Transcript_26452:20-823(-)
MNLEALGHQDVLEEIKQELLPQIIMGLYLDQIDDICLEICFELHKKLKCGQLCVDCDYDFSDIVCKPGHDIFGHTQSDMQNTNECFTCVNCSRIVVASRYAPHLEKCMGLGRSSSRIATKRLAVAAKHPKNNEFDQFDSDPDDRDFDYSPQEKAAKKEKQKMPKKQKKQHTGTVQVTSTSDMEELLSTTCGVISSTTKKMCTKTLNCPQHTDQMREEVRTTLLGKKVNIDELRDNLNKKTKMKKTEKTDYDSSSDSMAFVDVEGVDE